jgi:hypothetical protein
MLIRRHINNKQLLTFPFSCKKRSFPGSVVNKWFKRLDTDFGGWPSVNR